MRSTSPWRLLLAALLLFSLAEAGRADEFSAVEHQRQTIYHSPQTPGYPCWVGAWIMLDTKTPVGTYLGGGFGPTVQLDDVKLVTSYSYRGEDGMSCLEVVRWKTPQAAVASRNCSAFLELDRGCRRPSGNATIWASTWRRGFEKG